MCLELCWREHSVAVILFGMGGVFLCKLNHLTRVRRMRQVVLAVLLTVIWSAPVFGATFTVLNTNASGVGSLSQAITDANTLPGADIIAFNILPAGPKT